MDLFHVDCEVQNIVDRKLSRGFSGVLVDTGGELSWFPERELEDMGVVREKKDLAFVMANGQRITRSSGFTVIKVGDHLTVDEVVFAEAGDLSLLGARTLEGLNLMVDPAKKQLVAAGPMPAAGGPIDLFWRELE